MTFCCLFKQFLWVVFGRHKQMTYYPTQLGLCLEAFFVTLVFIALMPVYPATCVYSNVPPSFNQLHSHNRDVAIGQIIREAMMCGGVWEGCLIDVLAGPRATFSSQPLRGEGGQTEPGKTLLLFNEHKDDWHTHTISHKTQDNTDKHTRAHGTHTNTHTKSQT